MMYLRSLPTMHFLFYFPLIDVLSLLHSFAFALHISRIPLRLSSLGLGFSTKTPTVPLKPNIRLLAVARLYHHGRYLLHPHVCTCTQTPPFPPHLSCSSFPLVFIYSSRYTVSSPFCRPYWGTPMRGRGPPGYLALSSCTSFDIDVTLFANTLTLNRLSRCPQLAEGPGIGLSPWWQCQSGGVRLPVRF